MPDYQVTVAFVFGVNLLVTPAQLYWVIKGNKNFCTERLVSSLISAAVILFVLPLCAMLP